MEKSCQESRLLADSDSQRYGVQVPSPIIIKSPVSISYVLVPTTYDSIIHNRATHLLARPWLLVTVEAITKHSKGDQESGAMNG